MCECAREMTARNEIEALDIDEKVKDRILRKYDAEKAKDMEGMYQQVREKERELEQKAVEIKALTGYIAFRDL